MAGLVHCRLVYEPWARRTLADTALNKGHEELQVERVSTKPAATPAATGNIEMTRAYTTILQSPSRFVIVRNDSLGSDSATMLVRAYT